MAMVSVIVPVYNVEKYLHRCVDSILAQTFTDFELILVDDGSPDKCGAICDEYAQKDNRIRVIHKENGGPSSARNTGMEIAAGQYYMFCDSDDYVAPQWCERMFNAIRAHPNALVSSDIYKTGHNEDFLIEQEEFADEIMLSDYFSLYKHGISAYTPNKIFDSSIIRKNEIKFNPNCRFSEDVAFVVEYCCYCKEIVYIPQKLYCYNQNDMSLMCRYYDDLFALHLLPFWCRLQLIREEELGEYCDIWLYQFIHLFDNVFDPRNSRPFLKKMLYNQKMMNTKEFRYCLAHAAGKKETSLTISILETHNYYLYWVFCKLAQFKQKILRKKQ